VIRFQIIAATNAEAITVMFSTSWLTTPLPIVWATFIGKIVNAKKLKKAAIITATNGESTFVETTSAIEFAESWNPFKKSKVKVNATTIYRIIILLVEGFFKGSILNLNN
jgi:hypothetical protein